MNYPADSTAKLCQGGKSRYVGREGVPVDKCSREKCEPVVVFERLHRSVRVYTCQNVKLLEISCRGSSNSLVL